MNVQQQIVDTFYLKTKDYFLFDIFVLNPNDIVAGQRYSIDIFMDQTDQYDYLIQRCSYNNKYYFIDDNSCLIVNEYFIQKWETDHYYEYPGSIKRTIIHFIAPEELSYLHCQIKHIQCCGCAERACEFNILPLLENYHYNNINIEMIGNSHPFIYNDLSIFERL
ncbi:unnamed protein product [Dracunculus medinensis]|uniref:ZP domain-containing protein n=1 Tax=Dracunculus medinensis TaxID=318479 RepID=A0A158Q4H0_DRAME|nr:unnamed protein product [Dracunculus medinensis]